MGSTDTNRPVIKQLLSIPELRQRYLAHLRTVLQDSFNPTVLIPVIEQYQQLTIDALQADTKKNFTMTAYASDVAALKSFVQKRYDYLTNHTELVPVPPAIVTVSAPSTATALEIPYVTAKVQANGNDGLDSVWLYYRSTSYGRFTAVQMLDDGLHGDGAAGDGVFGGATTNYAAGTKVRFYIEARSGNVSRTACFAPARAEQETYHYHVSVAIATNASVVINELLASNHKTLADPQGEYDDWIELHNLTNQEVDMTGRYLTDDTTDPRKWAFPKETKIPAGGYLLIWADEDGKATLGVHANFKLSASGDQVFLIDTDANNNVMLDHVIFEAQQSDISYGRLPNNTGVWGTMTPTPGTANQ